MNDYINRLEKAFLTVSNPEIALQQKAYLKNKFEFYGIKTPARRELHKPFLSKSALPEKTQAITIIKELWNKPEREYQYFAQELAFRYKAQPDAKDIVLFELMVKNKSWWDTVDFIAASLIGNYFNHYPEKKMAYTEKWLRSGNIWLQRSALLFQLKYKSKVDTALLTQLISELSGSKEFFINKAIGWILREYSKTNPKWVSTFVKNNSLSNLSRKEGLRLIE